MRRLILVLCCCLWGSSGLAQTVDRSMLKAVALLYRQSMSGSLDMLCTTTAFEKTSKGYLFVSAAHCVGDDEDGKSADPKVTNFYVTMDDPTNKTFYAATVKGVGYQHRGDDFAYFEVETKDMLAFIPLGDENEEEVGGAVTNISSPYGLGRQLFTGSISSLKLERPVIVESINWQNAMLLQIVGPGPGSSGSAIISYGQHKIIGFLVGTIGTNNIVAIPVDRFKAFRDSVEKNKYKWYKPATTTESDEDPDKTSQNP